MHIPLFGALCVSILFGSGAAIPTSSCGNIPTPRPTPSPRFHCNSQGTTRDHSFLSRFKSSTGDITSCFDGCLGDAKCISFAYNTNNGFCQTFGQTIIEKVFSPSNSSGIFYYNAKGCFLPATCQPAPKQFIANGGFENAVLDSNGNYQSDPWQFNSDFGSRTIQKAKGYGHSSFSLTCTNLCLLSQALPQHLQNGSWYELSLDYFVPVDKGGPDSSMIFGFVYQQTFIGSLPLSGGPKTYTRYSTRFMYQEYTGLTTFISQFTGDSDNGQNTVTVVLDNISIVDAPAPGS